MQIYAPARGASLGFCAKCFPVLCSEAGLPCLFGSSKEVPGESSKKQPWLRALANSPLAQSWPESKETSPEGRETVAHQSRSCQVNAQLTILGLDQHPAMEVPRGGAAVWPLGCFCGWDVIPSGLGRVVGAGVQSRFQAALVNKTPHYFRDLLIVFLIRNTGNENTYFSIFADSSAFWCRHPGEAVIQSSNHVTTWGLMSNTFVLSILGLRKGL